MSIINIQESLRNASLQIAYLMIAAAKTAPKGKGVDELEYMVIIDDKINILVDKMLEISNKDNLAFIKRDAENIKISSAVVLIGSSYNAKNVSNCSNCGFGCADKPDYVPCAIGIVDLGIAIGSAASTAMLHKADNRIMYSAGIASLKLNWFSEKIKHAYGIPISLTEKSPYFDRK